MSTSRMELPSLESSYDDEYGPIDLEVYEAAQRIWPAARTFGEFALRDPDVAFNLMLNAAAKVTARMASDAEAVEKIQPYLFQTYKRLIGEERTRRLRHQQELSDDDDLLVVDVVADLERKIMLREMFSRMSEEERVLAQYLMFGYTYQEIAAMVGTTDEALRKRFSRLKQKLEQLLGTGEPRAAK